MCLIANRRNQRLSDYVLGGRGLSAPVTALGAGASDMSSWLLLAFPGAIFVSGMNHIWMPIGLLIGAYCNWRFVSKPLRIYTEIANDSLTIPSYLDHRFKQHSHYIRACSAIIILIFFTLYCAASFVSGGLLFQVAFGLSFQQSLLISSVIILIYTMVGGFLAINWIDFFQGTLMLLALIIVPLTAIIHVHNQHILYNELSHLPLDYFNPIKNITIVSMISLLAWGLGYFGQPHILTRFMAIQTPKRLPQARRICISWMFVSLLGATATGIVGRIFFDSGLANPEETFLHLTESLFTPIISGILFSAVLSAMMSTVAAQLLTSSSALIADFYVVFLRKTASQKELVIVARLCVIISSAAALHLAFNEKNTLFLLVKYAWSGIGASFGPIIITSLFWRRTTSQGAIAGITMGAITVILWKTFLSPLGGFWGLNEVIPGFTASSLAVIVASLLSKKPCPEVLTEFSKVHDLMLEK
tara:strand:- start:3440 stop:4858 length:1419 start_codon:yes stop_codon:yes gene_type:complete